MSGQRDKFETHVRVADAAQSPVDILHTETAMPKQQIKALMKNGAVWLTRGGNTRRLRRAKGRLRAEDELHLYFDRHVQEQKPVPPTLVADAGAYSVWNKPRGMRSQGSKWGDHCALPRWVEQHLQPQRSAFTVHRLDRAAHGLMLVAHSKGMAAQLSRLFSERRIDKQYRVTVRGDFSKQPVPLRCTHPLDEKPAVSEFRFAGRTAGGGESIIDVRIETGRKHQIRRHLALLDFPVVGDRLHGDAAADGPDLQLQACRLEFRCPVNQEDVAYVLDADG